MPGGGGGGGEGETWMEELSSEPRASLFHNFLVSILLLHRHVPESRCNSAHALAYDSD